MMIFYGIGFVDDRHMAQTIRRIRADAWLSKAAQQ